MNRRSSIYSLRVRTNVPSEVLQDLVSSMQRGGVPVLDQHAAKEDGARFAAVGFRAADDAEALSISEELLARAGYRSVLATLLTGFGVHRRIVAN